MNITKSILPIIISAVIVVITTGITALANILNE